MCFDGEARAVEKLGCLPYAAKAGGKLGNVREYREGEVVVHAFCTYGKHTY